MLSLAYASWEGAKEATFIQGEAEEDRELTSLLRATAPSKSVSLRSRGSVRSRSEWQRVGGEQRYRSPATRYKSFFYPGQGHDTDRILAPVYSREFLEKILRK